MESAKDSPSSPIWPPNCKAKQSSTRKATSKHSSVPASEPERSKARRSAAAPHTIQQPERSNTMQAIQSKFLPATDHKGSRIKATCERGSITIPYPHELSGEFVHRLAVTKLVWKFLEEDYAKNRTAPESNPWSRDFSSGTLPDGTVAHVFLH